MLRQSRCGSKWKAELPELTECRGRELVNRQDSMSTSTLTELPPTVTKETILSQPFMTINTTNFKHEIEYIIFALLLNVFRVTKAQEFTKTNFW